MQSYLNNKALESHKTIYRLVNSGYLSTNQACQILGLTRQSIWYRRRQIEKYGSYGYSRKRGPKPYSRTWNRTGKEIENLVEALRESFNIGPDRIMAMLDEQGIKLARATVYRILVRKKLLPTKKTIRRNYKKYTLGYPGAELQIDATFLEGRKSWVIFAGVDDHTRWGFAKLYPRCTVSNNIDFLNNILKEAPFPIQAIRTDNGNENTKAFTNKCQKHNITHVRNKPRMPIHNGKVERFHRTVQEECLWRITTNHPKEILDYELNRYLGFYNFHRHHFGLGMEGKTPFSKLKHFIKQNRRSKDTHVKRTMILYTQKDHVLDLHILNT
jgi:transposase